CPEHAMTKRPVDENAPPRPKARPFTFPWAMVLAIAVPLLVVLIVGRFAWHYFAGAGAGDREELHNRLVGEWHADLQATPRVRIGLKIDEGGLTPVHQHALRGRYESGRRGYEVVGHWRDQLTIRTTNDEGRPVEWKFIFRGDNEAQWTDLTEKNPVRV